MDSIPHTGSPPDQAPPASQEASDPITQSLIDLADRLASVEVNTETRFDAVRSAFADLRSELRKGQESPQGSASKLIDEPRRRLLEFLGYTPTIPQQTELFKAYASWHATEPKLQENRTADFETKKGGKVVYSYADLAAVILASQSAARFGLCAFSRQELDDTGTPIVTGYLVHIDGGAISLGPVPLFVGSSERPGQEHSKALTTARRLALQMAIGLAAERDDDFNASSENLAPGRAAGRPSGSPLPAGERNTLTPPRRVVNATARPAAPIRQGPPPGWLSKEERTALEQELMDPAITPTRFQEIEEKLLAAKHAVTSGGPGQ